MDINEIYSLVLALWAIKIKYNCEYSCWILLLSIKMFRCLEREEHFPSHRDQGQRLVTQIQFGEGDLTGLQIGPKLVFRWIKWERESKTN